MSDSADEPFDPNTFVVMGLPWIVAVPGHHQKVTVRDVAQITLRREGFPTLTAIPIFTDKDLAERFIRDLGDKGRTMQPLQPNTSQLLAGILTQLQQHGITHVVFDPGPGKGAPRSIASVIAGFQSGKA